MHWLVYTTIFIANVINLHADLISSVVPWSWAMILPQLTPIRKKYLTELILITKLNFSFLIGYLVIGIFTQQKSQLWLKMMFLSIIFPKSLFFHYYYISLNILYLRGISSIFPLHCSFPVSFSHWFWYYKIEKMTYCRIITYNEKAIKVSKWICIFKPILN